MNSDISFLISSGAITVLLHINEKENYVLYLQ
jgi:hypothetical protein